MSHVHFVSKHLALHQSIITKHRKFGKNEASQGRNPVVQVVCCGTCNKVERMKVGNLKTGNVFVCNDKNSREACRRSLPRVIHGKVRVIHPQQAGRFSGVTYEDQGRVAAFKAACADVADGFIQSLTSLGLRKD